MISHTAANSDSYSAQKSPPISGLLPRAFPGEKRSEFQLRINNSSIVVVDHHFLRILNTANSDSSHSGQVDRMLADQSSFLLWLRAPPLVSL
jgi:hypothetical protein